MERKEEIHILIKSVKIKLRDQLDSSCHVATKTILNTAKMLEKYQNELDELSPLDIRIADAIKNVGMNKIFQK